MDDVFFDRKHGLHLLPPNTTVYDRVSVYGLLIEHGNILLVRPVGFQTWELPGGGLENAESEVDALVREFFEETGLTINTVGKCVYTDHGNFYADDIDVYFHSTRKVFVIHEYSGVMAAQANDTDKVKWFCRNEILSEAILNSDKMAMLTRILGDWGKTA